jgi:hypothetical protein
MNTATSAGDAPARNDGGNGVRGSDHAVLSRENVRVRGAPGMLPARHQARLFFPMLFLAGVRALAGRGATPGTNTSRTSRLVEGGLLLAHAAGYLAVVFWVLAPVQAVGFLLLQQGLFGFYPGCSFAPGHKGMPILSKEDQSSSAPTPGHCVTCTRSAAPRAGNRSAGRGSSAPRRPDEPRDEGRRHDLPRAPQPQWIGAALRARGRPDTRHAVIARLHGM